MLSKELLLFDAYFSQCDLVNALVLFNYLLFLFNLVSLDLVLSFDVYGRHAVAFLDLLLLNDGLLCCVVLE